MAMSNQEQVVDEELYDVLIVGAGVSGATAAYTLKKQCPELRILIIEGKERVGGRTHTIELNSATPGKKTKFDAGGQWVTDSQEVVTKLINELNIETYTQFDTGRKLLEYNGQIVKYDSSIPNISLPSLVEIYLKLNKINSTAAKVNTMNPFENLKLADQLDSTNLDQFLSKHSYSSAVKSILTAAVRVVYGLELNQINTLFGLMYIKSGGTIEKLTLAEKGCAQEKRVKGGTQQITQKMIDFVLGQDSKSKLVLNTALLHVIQHEANPTSLVKVQTQNTETGVRTCYQARKVISSIPVNQYVHVQFTPELPYFKRNCFKFMQMGNYIKFIVTYKRAFWRLNGFSGESVSDGSIMSKQFIDFKGLIL